MSDQRTIFVSIASFCDPYLRFSIESAMAQATQPERIVLGVVDQSSEPLNPWLADQVYADRVRYLLIDPLHSRGVCWARHLAQALFDDEDFFLQVDSHTWFQPGWDELLVQHMQRLSQVSHKPLLSIYPPGFEFDADGQPVIRRDLGPNVGAFVPKPNQALSGESRVLKFKAISRQPLSDNANEADAVDVWHYARGTHLAGGFLLASGEFVHEVPYDPSFYFHGEEQGLALRAFTHGWDVFHPQFNRVPVHHLYKVPQSASPNLHWRHDFEARRRVKWPERRTRARQRLNELIAGRLKPPYGLGEQRSLAEFIACSGLDYLNNELRESDLAFVRLPEPAES